MISIGVAVGWVCVMGVVVISIGPYRSSDGGRAVVAVRRTDYVDGGRPSAGGGGGRDVLVIVDVEPRGRRVAGGLRPR